MFYKQAMIFCKLFTGMFHVDFHHRTSLTNFAGMILLVNCTHKLQVTNLLVFLKSVNGKIQSTLRQSFLNTVDYIKVSGTVALK